MTIAQAIDCLRQTVVFCDGAGRHERFGQVVPPAVAPVLARGVPWRAGSVRCRSRPRGRRLRIAEAMAHPASLMYGYWEAVCWPSIKVTCKARFTRARTGHPDLSGREPLFLFLLDGCNAWGQPMPGWARCRRCVAAHAGGGAGDGNGSGVL